MVTSVTFENLDRIEYSGRHMIRVMWLHMVTSVTSELFSRSRISRPTYVQSYVVTLVTTSYKYFCKFVEKVFFPGLENWVTRLQWLHRLHRKIFLSFQNFWKSVFSGLENWVTRLHWLHRLHRKFFLSFQKISKKCFFLLCETGLRGYISYNKLQVLL